MLMSDLQNQNMPDDSTLERIVSHFTLDIGALRNEWTLLINGEVINVSEPHKILKQLVETKQTSVYIELTVLLKKLCIIAFTSASCERTFSQLAIVKSKLHTSITQRD